MRYLVLSYYLAPPFAGPFVFGAPCFGHMRVETAGLLLRSLLTFGPVRLARGLLFGLRHRAVLAQNSRRLNAS